ncbi:MAG: glycosyl hydrolase family 28-related protein [Chloroflexota bacterium]
MGPLHHHIQEGSNVAVDSSSVIRRPSSILFITVLLLGLILPAVVLADVIPPERLVAWDPGVRGDIPTYYYVADVKDFGAVGDGVADDGPAFNAAIQAAATPGFIWVPPGDYRIATIIQMKSGIVLQGAGPTQSRLLFDLPGYVQRGGIEFNGWAETADIPVQSGYTFGSTALTLDSTAGMAPGTLLWLYQDDDEAVMYTADYWRVDYGQYSMSQMVGVAAVNGNTITLDAPLRLDYTASLNPRVRIVHPIENAGLESLYLERLDAEDAYTVSMTYAQNCWVRYVESKMSFRAHIWAFYSRFLTFTTNYFHEAHDYGDGGHGYGVTLADSTSDVLVTNNIFHTLRHSMMVKEGANGNVFSYNYSFDNQLLKADVSMHGHYNYANLFEGNVVRQMIVSDWWGPSGKFSTLFRNRVSDLTGISVRDHSHYTNVVANNTTRIEIRTDPDIIIFGYPIYMGEVENELVDGNLVGGVYTWSGEPIPASYYLDAPPEFWGNKPWPAIGGDVDQTYEPDVRLPAQDRYQLIQQGAWRPPLPLILTSETAGLTTTLTVINANPNEQITFVQSTAGPGPGPCPPPLGGLCLDILNPVAILGRVRADSTGTAVFTTPFAGPIWVQAVAKRGAAGADSVKTNVVSVPTP